MQSHMRTHGVTQAFLGSYGELCVYAVIIYDRVKLGNAINLISLVLQKADLG